MMRCVFKFGEQVFFVESEHLEDFSSGFWIDRTHQLARTPATRDRWIPPHKIEWVESSTSPYPYSGMPGSGPGIPLA